MKAKVWLERKGVGGWAYGLGRLENGTIIVAECFPKYGFGRVGTTDPLGGEQEPIRLNKGERNLIIADLFVASAQEMGMEITGEMVEMLRAFTSKRPKEALRQLRFDDKRQEH